MTSCVQFSARPGVGGIPPIVRTAATNTRWFATTLVGDTVEVVEGVVFCPPLYSKNASSYPALLETVSVPGGTLTLTTTITQLIILRCTFANGHTATEGDPFFSIFDHEGQDSVGFSGSVASHGAQTVTADAPAFTLYGSASRVMWKATGTFEVLAISSASYDSSTDIVLAEVVYDPLPETYTLTPRHDGAVFLFPPVWPIEWSYNW